MSESCKSQIIPVQDAGVSTISSVLKENLLSPHLERSRPQDTTLKPLKSQLHSNLKIINSPFITLANNRSVTLNITNETLPTTSLLSLSENHSQSKVEIQPLFVTPNRESQVITITNPTTSAAPSEFRTPVLQQPQDTNLEPLDNDLHSNLKIDPPFVGSISKISVSPNRLSEILLSDMERTLIASPPVLTNVASTPSVKKIPPLEYINSTPMQEKSNINKSDPSECAVSVQIEWETKTKRKILTEDIISSLGKMLCRGTYKQIARAAWRCKPLQKHFL